MFVYPGSMKTTSCWHLLSKTLNRPESWNTEVMMKIKGLEIPSLFFHILSHILFHYFPISRSHSRYFPPIILLIKFQYPRYAVYLLMCSMCFIHKEHDLWMTEDEMVGWHHWFDGWVWTNSVRQWRTRGQFMELQSRTWHSDWTKTIISLPLPQELIFANCPR